MITVEQLSREFKELLPVPNTDPSQQALRVTLARVFKGALTLAMQAKTTSVELHPATDGQPAVTTNVDAFVGFDSTVSEQAATSFALVTSLWDSVCAAHKSKRFTIRDYKDQSITNTQVVVVNMGDGYKKMSFAQMLDYLETTFGV